MRTGPSATASFTAVTRTACGTFQFDGVKTSVVVPVAAATAVTCPSAGARAIRTSCEGARQSTSE